MDRKTLIIALILLLLPMTLSAKVYKLLAIGNSFSEDAVESYLADICRSQRVEVVIGNLYIPGCSIDTHWDNLEKNAPAYRYRKIDRSGKVTERKQTALKTALDDEKWDFISFQQASQYSGEYSSFGHLKDLIVGVRNIVGNGPVFVWHQTWAYAATSGHAGFAAYDNNQLNMYHRIVETTRKVMQENPQLKILIPCGTAIQNARTAILAGDDLTRDGYHLERTTGRYIASLTWYTALFMRIPAPDVFFPKGVDSNTALLARDAAVEAVLHPWMVTSLAGKARLTSSDAAIPMHHAYAYRRDL